ncbi:MAG: hypothetical protein JWM18_2058, partial [Chloroflexi bacterium]|nr:hypothetical protein [Chloroflexota bacterium]
ATVRASGEGVSVIPVTIPAPVLRAAVRATFHPVLSRGVPLRLQRPLTEALLRPLAVTRGAHIRSTNLGGVPTEVVEHDGADRSAAVVYLHGGGFTTLSPVTHRGLAAHLALAAGCPVYLPRYRLAPEHPCPAALEDALAAHQALLTSGCPPGRVALAGDSAGANLIVAVALRLRERGGPPAAALGLISPWLDLTLSGPSVTAEAAGDPLLKPSWLRLCARRYAGVHALDDPTVSPLFADLHGLPPVFVQGGANDVLVSDADRFVERARASGVRVEHDRVEGMWHDFQVLAGLLAAAGPALARLGTFLRTCIEGSPRPPSVAIMGGGLARLGMASPSSTRPAGPVTGDGVERRVDAIIYGTGFSANGSNTKLGSGSIVHRRRTRRFDTAAHRAVSPEAAGTAAEHPEPAGAPG